MIGCFMNIKMLISGEDFFRQGDIANKLKKRAFKEILQLLLCIFFLRNELFNE